MTVLACLLQQLGTNLETETTMKLEWLKQIALGIDKSNEDIAAYAPQVIEQLQANMQVLRVRMLVAARTELALITRFVRSIAYWTTYAEARSSAAHR